MSQLKQIIGTLWILFIVKIIGGDHNGCQVFVRFSDEELAGFEVTPSSNVGDLRRLITDYKHLDPLITALELSVPGNDISLYDDQMMLSDLGICSQMEIACNVIPGTVYIHSMPQTTLNAPGMIVSKDRNTRLVFSRDTDLVLYHRSNSSAEWKETWSRGKTSNIAPRKCFLNLQGDSNLVIYTGDKVHPGNAYWAHMKHGFPGPNTLIVHNDGTVTQQNERRGQVWKIP